MLPRAAMYADHEYQYADPLELRRSLEERAGVIRRGVLYRYVMPYGETYREAQLTQTGLRLSVTTLLPKYGGKHRGPWV